MLLWVEIFKKNFIEFDPNYLKIIDVFFRKKEKPNYKILDKVKLLNSNYSASSGEEIPKDTILIQDEFDLDDTTIYKTYLKEEYILGSSNLEITSTGGTATIESKG